MNCKQLTALLCHVTWTHGIPLHDDMPANCLYQSTSNGECTGGTELKEPSIKDYCSNFIPKRIAFGNSKQNAENVILDQWCAVKTSRPPKQKFCFTGSDYGAWDQKTSGFKASLLFIQRPLDVRTHSIAHCWELLWSGILADRLSETTESSLVVK
jgi:hypothetical protein